MFCADFPFSTIFPTDEFDTAETKEKSKKIPSKCLPYSATIDTFCTRIVIPSGVEPNISSFHGFDNRTVMYTYHRAWCTITYLPSHCFDTTTVILRSTGYLYRSIV